MSEEQYGQLNAMFKSFAPLYAERWGKLLAGKAAGWQKIQPWRAWPVDVFDSMPDGIAWPAMVEMAARDAAGQKVKKGVLLACGHSSSCVEDVPLSALIERLCGTKSETRLLEGFVSLVPGELALATNHEGGCWLMKKTKKEK
ncbi:hypothetical protein [Variovorax sp. YR750]|uniref:hypothetical protein n=1 Tax=Variovorax sp. YR750 TaxID=1884384 RepID=UPI001160680E|nr:hypothetical protein [Variovorax sp. YR750]MDP9605991.1 hypothetical protein [Variovorax paradoxus]